MHEQAFVATFDDPTATLSLSGIVDELSIAEMEDAVRRATRDHTAATTIDLSGLDFLPSIGLGVLAMAIRDGRVADAPVTLLARRGSLAQRVLEVSGLPFELV